MAATAAATTAAAVTSPLEKTTADLRVARFMVHKLGETFDSFQIHSCSILSLAEQWRNLQATFGEVNKSLESRVKEMEAKEREFGVVANKLQRSKEEVELKRKTLEFGEKSLNDRTAKLETRHNELKKWFEMIDVKKRQVIEREKAVEAKEKELAKGLERVKKVDDDEIRVRKVEEEVNECRKAVELEKVRVGKVAEELESREKQVDERCKSVELRESRVDERFKEVELKESRVDERCREVELRENRVEERFKELKVKEREIKLWEEVLGVKETRLDEDVRVMDAREIQLVKDRQALEFREDEMDKLYSLVELRESEINERFKEVEMKEKELKSREEDVKVQCEELKSKDKDIIERLNKLMVDENDFVERLNTLKAKEKDLRDACRALKDKENEFNARVASLEAREEGVSKRIRDLEVKEKGVKAQCVVLEAKEAALNDRWEKLEVKRKEVDERGKAMKLKEKKVEESRREVEVKEEKVEELRRGVELKRKEVDERGKAMKLKEKEMEESRREVEVKEKKVEELRRGVELKEKDVKELLRIIELKGKEVDGRSKAMKLKEKEVEELRRGVEMKEKEVEELRRGVEMKEKEVEELRRRAELKEIGVDELLRIVESKEKEMNEGLKLKQTQIDERSKEIEVKEKEINERVKEMGLKEKQISRRKKALDLREKQFEDSKKVLELKERQVDDRCVEPKEKQCDELVEAVESVDVQPKEVSQVVESKKEQPCEIPQTMELKEEQTNGPSQGPSELTEFGTQKLDVEQNKMKLELKGKQVIDGVTTQENMPTLKECQKGDAAHGSRSEQTDELWKKVVDLKENQVADKIQKHEEGQKPSDNRDCKSVVKSNGGEDEPFRFRAMSGKILQMHLNDRFNEHGSMSEEIAKMLRSMTNPGKIVLDAVDGFFAPHLCKDGVAYETRVVRSSCLLLLEHLMNMRSTGLKALKKEASTVAIKWRAKMKLHGETEDVVLGFLLLHGAFYLHTLVKKTELRRLCGKIDHHKLAPRLRQRLGVLKRGSEGSEVARKEPVQSDSLQVDNGHDAVDPLPAKIPDIHVSCRRMDDKGVLLYLIEHIKEYNALQDKILDALRNASDPAKLVLNVCKSCVIDHDKNRDDVGNTVCLFLLKQLMKSSPSISPEVCKEAKEFADFLKAKLKGRDVVLYYRFLQFVASYKLTTTYHQDELLKYFQFFYYGMDVYRPDDNAHLCFALGLAKKIPGLIRSLIDRNKLLSAVKFICVFKLERTFPPVPILETILEDVKKRVDEKRKEGTFKTKVDAERIELFALGGVVSCITNFKLESELPLDRFVARIKELENEKEKRASANGSRKRAASSRPSSTTPSQEKRPRLGPVQQSQHVPPVILSPFPPGPPPMQPSYGLPAYNTHFYAHTDGRGVGQHLAPGHFMPGAEMYPVGAPMHNHRVNDPTRIAPYQGR